MQAIYIYFRWWQRLYDFLTKFFYNYHEEKKIQTWWVNILKYLHWLFLIIPGILLVQLWIKDNPRFDWINLQFSNFLSFPVMKSLYTFFETDSVLFSVVGACLFGFSNLYKNAFKAYKIDNIYTEEFHNTNHMYRNFTSWVVSYLKDRNRYFKLDYEKDKDLIRLLENRYLMLIRRLCREAAESLSQIINDKNSYITIKLYSEKEDIFKITHYFALDSTGNKKFIGKHLGENRQATFKKDEKNTLFHEIINKFNKFELSKNINAQKHLKDSGDQIYFNIGILSCDVKGDSRFDNNSVPDFYKRFKSTLIVPIIIDYSIKGFLCFNSTRTGMLREKHKNHLAGYADTIACLLRNVLYYQEA